MRIQKHQEQILMLNLIYLINYHELDLKKKSVRRDIFRK